MTNSTEAEQQAVNYLEAGKQLMVTKAKLAPDQAFRVFVVYALSVIRHAVGGTDKDLAAWLRAEADAIDLHGSPPSGSA